MKIIFYRKNINIIKNYILYILKEEIFTYNKNVFNTYGDEINFYNKDAIDIMDKNLFLKDI